MDRFPPTLIALVRAHGIFYSPCCDVSSWSSTVLGAGRMEVDRAATGAVHVC